MYVTMKMKKKYMYSSLNKKTGKKKKEKYDIQRIYYTKSWKVEMVGMETIALLKLTERRKILLLHSSSWLQKQL